MTFYASKNFKTKKDFKKAVEAGERIWLRAPGLGHPQTDGTESVCGPWYPEPHRWYAVVQVKDGVVQKVT